MIHSFEVVAHNNRNRTVKFYENNKLRKIVFTYGTDAMNDFLKLSFHKSNSIKDCIARMKKKYFFKANKNNKSIFRPIEKSLILKSI